MNGARPQASTAFFLTHLSLCSLAWGSSFLLIKLTHGEVSPPVLAACRGLFGGLTLMLVTLLRRQVPLPARDEIVPWLVIGTINGFVPNLLVAYGLTRLDSGAAALLQAAGPLLTAIGAHLMFTDERLNAWSLAGVLVGLAGVALLIGPSAGSGAGGAMGALAMLGVAACYALGNLYTRLVRHHPADRLALGQQVTSGLLASVVAMGVTGPAGFGPVADHLLPLLALGTLATALPMTVFMRMIVAVGPTRAAMTGYTVPTVAVILGVLVLGERLTVLQSVGGAVVFLGVWMVAIARRRGA